MVGKQVEREAWSRLRLAITDIEQEAEAVLRVVRRILVNVVEMMAMALARGCISILFDETGLNRGSQV